MRIFEIAIVLTLFTTLFGFFIPKKKRPSLMNYLPILAIFFTIIHLVFETYRWQMVAVYCLVIILFLFSIIQITQELTIKSVEPSSRGYRILSYFLTTVGILYLIIAIALPILIPVFQLPTPTGSYSIGTTFINFVDSSRAETLNENPNDCRKFMARVWYPAEKIHKLKPLSYRKHISPIGSIIPKDSNEMGSSPPDFFFSHLSLLKSNSYLDAPLSNTHSSYPIILFSGGFLSDFDGYQVIMEELASQGYIVLSLNQPYESQAVIQPDETVVHFSQEHAEKYRQHQTIIIPFWEKFWTSSDENERNEIAKNILANETFMDNNLRIRTSDILFVIDELEKINSSKSKSIFYEKLDMLRLGIMGHSMGGAVAAQVCLVDKRFKAGINLDGFQFGDVVSGVVQQPFMIMYSESFRGANDFVLDRFENTTYIITIKGSTHIDYSDESLIFPIIKYFGISGKIPTKQMICITNDYIISFFNKYLKSEPTPLLNRTSSSYVEVDYDVHNLENSN